MSKFTDQQKIEIVTAYISGKSCIQVGKEFGCSPSNVAGLLKTRKISLRSSDITNRRHEFNFNYFDLINSEEKAYWLGFIVAEGNIYRNTLAIELGAKDKEHLKKFANALSYKYFNDYNQKKNSYRIRLNSKYLINSLLKLGVHTKKCNDIIVPPIQEQYFRHFFRGFVDGDGSLGKLVDKRRAARKIKKKNRINCLGIDKYTTLKLTAGSDCFQFLNDFKDWVNEKLGNTGGFIECRFYNGKMRYKLIFCGNILATKVAGLLYNDCAIVMDRRKEKFLELFKCKKHG
jgi:intein-encoded DNA endonuclease-like protein